MTLWAEVEAFWQGLFQGSRGGAARQGTLAWRQLRTSLSASPGPAGPPPQRLAPCPVCGAPAAAGARNAEDGLSVGWQRRGHGTSARLAGAPPPACIPASLQPLGLAGRACKLLRRTGSRLGAFARYRLFIEAAPSGSAIWNQGCVRMPGMSMRCAAVCGGGRREVSVRGRTERKRRGTENQAGWRPPAAHTNAYTYHSTLQARSTHSRPFPPSPAAGPLSSSCAAGAGPPGSRSSPRVPSTAPGRLEHW